LLPDTIGVSALRLNLGPRLPLSNLKTSQRARPASSHIKRRSRAPPQLDISQRRGTDPFYHRNERSTWHIYRTPRGGRHRREAADLAAPKAVSLAAAPPGAAVGIMSGSHIRH